MGAVLKYEVVKIVLFDNIIAFDDIGMIELLMYVHLLF